MSLNQRACVSREGVVWQPLCKKQSRAPANPHVQVAVRALRGLEALESGLPGASQGRRGPRGEVDRHAGHLNGGLTETSDKWVWRPGGGSQHVGEDDSAADRPRVLRGGSVADAAAVSTSVTPAPTPSAHFSVCPTSSRVLPCGRGTLPCLPESTWPRDQLGWMKCEWK